MNFGLYFKLAIDGIKNNRKIYFPFIFTTAFMISVYYILASLVDSKAIQNLIGAGTIMPILRMGSFVIIIFSSIFLLYTYSFILRNRKKEFGLYNILGMSKANIIKILFIEIVIVAIVSFCLGMISGIIFSKIAELGLINLLKEEVDYNFFFSINSLITASIFFAFIFILLFLNALRQILATNTISLIKSDNLGEKPPKGNWLLGLVGLLSLGTAYYIAIRYANPVDALLAFFIAVILVIIGTYLVLISGSVYFCRLLSKHKNFYYKPNHFISVSSMAYRMKRNGASLASICILATMILVIISSTTCLYFATNELLLQRYPKDLNFNFRVNSLEDLSDENLDRIKQKINSELSDYQATIEEGSYNFKSVAFVSTLEQDRISTQISSFENLNDYGKIYQTYFIPLSDYNAMFNTHEELSDNEVLVYSNRTDFNYDQITFNDYATLQVKGKIEEFPNFGMAAMNISESIIIVIPNYMQTLKAIGILNDSDKYNQPNPIFIYNLDTNLDENSEEKLYTSLIDTFSEEQVDHELGIESVDIESQKNKYEDYYSTFGGIFYLGIILSLVFVIGAVLIIYYKQISEGYEDKSRFEIMQKVGITKREIRKSINSQLLLIFFIPLIFAVIHLIFAFPMIQKILLLFNLNNIGLFLITTIISVLVFAVFYIFVYILTSNVYYQIVSHKS